MHVDLEKFYVLEGRDMAALLQISYRLNDGGKLSPDERRDLAQQMQALLAKRTEFDP